MIDCSKRMYFISRAFQGIKSVICGLALLGSGGMIIYGAVIGVGGAVFGWVTMGVGIVCFIPAAFGVFESTKLLNDIRKEVENFKKQITAFEEQNAVYKQENGKLQENVNSLEHIKTEIMDENKKLSDLAERQTATVQQMDELKSQYEIEVEKFKSQSVKFTQQNQILIGENQELKETVGNIETIKEELKKQNGTYQQQLAQMDAHIKSVTQMQEQYMNETNRLEQSLIEERSQLELLTTQTQEQQKQIANLKNALDASEKQALALKALVIQLKELYRNLVLAGDAFKSFQDTIGGDVEKLDNSTNSLQNTVEQMTNLMVKLNTKLIQSDFDKMDKNDDGKISEEEFKEYIEKDTRTTNPNTTTTTNSIENTDEMV